MTTFDKYTVLQKQEQKELMGTVEEFKANSDSSIKQLKSVLSEMETLQKQVSLKLQTVCVDN